VARGDLGAELPIEDVPLLQVRSHYMYSYRCTKPFLAVSSKERCVKMQPSSSII
jgi:pyruvate kinase